MSIFGTIMNKIFHHGQAAHPAVPGSAPDPTAAAAAGSVNSGILAAATEMQSAADAAVAASASAASAPTAAASAQPVDVGAVLTQMAAQKGGASNWQSSIVDLLKLLDMDSSLAARKELAGELNVHVGADGSAEENIALHKAVMQKLAENGGKVPDELRN